MKRSKKEIYIDHKAEDLYDIVLDIEKYPNYIPWCTSIEIKNKKQNNIRAEMIVNYKFFSTQKFTSNVIFNTNKLLFKLTILRGL